MIIIIIILKQYVLTHLINWVLNRYKQVHF